MPDIRKSNLKEGDEVWWFDSDHIMQHGTIYLVESEEKIADGELIALISSDATSFNLIGVLLSECSPTKEACLKAEAEKVEAKKEEYKASITDIESLVRFLLDYDSLFDMYEHRITRAAAKERAKELLGIEYE